MSRLLGRLCAHWRSVNKYEFTSSELVAIIVEAENWGDKLVGRNSRTQAGIFGRFLQNFLPAKRILEGITQYRRADVLAKLSAHLPQSPPKPTEPHTDASMIHNFGLTTYQFSNRSSADELLEGQETTFTASIPVVI